MRRTSVPEIRTLPAAVSQKRMRSLSSVDLPEPERPAMQVMVPTGKVQLTSSRMSARGVSSASPPALSAP